MPELLSTLFAGALALAILAAVIYIIGFMVSMFATVFIGPVEAIKHRHTHQPI